jgi:hypothetical protein
MREVLEKPKGNNYQRLATAKEVKEKEKISEISWPTDNYYYNSATDLEGVTKRNNYQNLKVCCSWTFLYFSNFIIFISIACPSIDISKFNYYKNQY